MRRARRSRNIARQRSSSRVHGSFWEPIGQPAAAMSVWIRPRLGPSAHHAIRSAAMLPWMTDRIRMQTVGAASTMTGRLAIVRPPVVNASSASDLQLP